MADTPARRREGEINARQRPGRRPRTSRAGVGVDARVRLREYREGDEVAINAAFNAAFGLARPLEEWRWKFPAEPDGRWIVVGEDAAGAIVGHAAAIPVWLQVGEQRVLAGHNVDVFALSRARAGLGAARAYLETARAFFALYLNPERLAVVLGFPGPRNDPLTVRRLGCSPVAAVRVWRRDTARRGSWWLGHELCESTAPEATDVLWSRAGQRFPVAAVRGARWYGHRFRGRPGVGYRFLTAWRRGRPHAAGVVRIGPDTLWVCDWVWDGEDRRAVRVLDGGIAALARRHGCCQVETWLMGDPALAAVLTDLGWTSGPHPAGLRMVARSGDPRIGVERLAAGMYVTMADADLV